MHDALFADAARPEGATVLNLPLLEYSIGHQLLLWRHSNPLLTHDWRQFIELPLPEQREAVMLAALVCSRPWQGNPKTKRQLRRWARKTRRLETHLEAVKFRA